MDHKAMYKLTYGLYLLTAQADGKDNGCIINTAVQVANDPTRVSIAVIKGGCTHDMVAATGMFNLSCLTVEAPFALFRHFGMQSGRNADKFADFADVARSENGLYYLTTAANGYLSCKVLSATDLGSHTLFVAEVVDGAVLGNAESCTYAYYQSTIKQKPAPAQKTGWVCSVCGYVYEGDEVPDDFLCPLCKHGKKDFVKLGAENKAEAKPAEKSAENKTDENKSNENKSDEVGVKWVCSVCGYVHEGAEPPAQCPVCKVGAEKFTKQSAERTWAAEHILGVANGAPAEIIEGLRANFEGECSEVGMYLAMARVAHREGFPEVGSYWHKAGWEEAEHAAKFAELLGEVVTDSTKKNLAMRVDAEFGATAGKVALADLAREHGLDAIADTVMEMAKDEARHGKALKGLLERYFK